MKVTYNLGDSLTLYEFERGRFVYDDMLNIKFKIGIHFNQLNEIHFYSKGQQVNISDRTSAPSST